MAAPFCRHRLLFSLVRQPMAALGCCKAVKSSGSVGVCLLPCYSISLSPERGGDFSFSFIASLCAKVGDSQGFGYNSWYISLCYTLCHHSPAAAPLVSASAAASHTISCGRKQNSARREIKKVEKTLKREGKKKQNGRKKHAEIGKQDLLTRMNGGREVENKISSFFRLLGVAPRFSQKAAGKSYLEVFFSGIEFSWIFVVALLRFCITFVCRVHPPAHLVIKLRSRLLCCGFFELKKRGGKKDF